MKSPIWNTIRGYLRSANEWLIHTPERALNDAYEAALMIKSIEDKHFGGNKISANYGSYGESVQRYFQAELKKYLNVIKVRLTEFRASKSIVQISQRTLSNRPITEIDLSDEEEETGASPKINIIDKPALILKKLRFIDEILERYRNQPEPAPMVLVSDSVTVNGRKKMNTDRTDNTNRSNTNSRIVNRREEQTAKGHKTENMNQSEDGLLSNTTRPDRNHASRAESSSEDIESIVDKTGVLPRSILKTVERIKRELDPNAEEEVVETFRNSKARTIIALRLILLLIIVPLLTQQLSRIVLVGPLVDHFRPAEETPIFLNSEMEEEALAELNMYRERMEFEILIGKIDPLTEEQKEERLEVRAAELSEEFHQRSNDAIKNVFSDIFAVIAFTGLIINSKREVAVLKSFIDELIYGLSDSAKAFIIILLTDTFVGFHSPHGWEVLLEGISRHLGLPANRDFIFLFIATFPVILDTIFKYWIFRYLNRISPSAVATYRNMNE
jgi:hypothetical protein